MKQLKAPFPWFGGKSLVAKTIWHIISPYVLNYVEPFGGSLAVLLGRPNWLPASPWVETVNDRDGFVANFWRAVKADPEQVAQYADNPVNENDLHARHVWLMSQIKGLVPRLEGDPDFYDARVAGYWVWGVSTWIGHGFCSGRGPWGVTQDEQGYDILVKTNADEGNTKRVLPSLGNSGKGVVARHIPSLSKLGGGVGVLSRQLPRLVTSAGVNKTSVDLHSTGLVQWMLGLSERLRRVRIASGDWKRVCGPAVTTSIGKTFLFLDPPYSTDKGDRGTVYSTDDGHVAHEVRQWCLDLKVNKNLFIILCGYRGEHDDELLNAGWHPVGWKARGGYGLQAKGRGRENRNREVLWLSPSIDV